MASPWGTRHYRTGASGVDLSCILIFCALIEGRRIRKEKDQSRGPSKLAGCQAGGKYSKGNTDYFVDYLHYLWMVAKFAERGTQRTLSGTPVERNPACEDGNDTAARSRLYANFERLCRNGSDHEKKTPFCSRPSTEIRFVAGLGASDWKRKPACSADQLIVAAVLRNVPLNPCELL